MRGGGEKEEVYAVASMRHCVCGRGDGGGGEAQGEEEREDAPGGVRREKGGGRRHITAVRGEVARGGGGLVGCAAYIAAVV